MKAITAKKIVNAAFDIGYNMEIRDYSGRCMFGEQTTAIVYEKLGEFLGAVAYAANNSLNSDADGYDLDQFIEDLQGLRTDNMGKSDIVVY